MRADVAAAQWWKNSESGLAQFIAVLRPPIAAFPGSLACSETSFQMPNPLNHFLRHGTGLSERASLGRTFDVTRESWRLSDDPNVVCPDTELLTSRQPASDAAELARKAAKSYPRHGFHKASGAWWGADDKGFHRFFMHAARPGASAAVFLMSGLAGTMALAVASYRGRGRRRAK